jgi:hypothetical protein
MAYKVAENNCTKSGGSTKRDDGSKEHTVSCKLPRSEGRGISPLKRFPATV